MNDALLLISFDLDVRSLRHQVLIGRIQVWRVKYNVKPALLKRALRLLVSRRSLLPYQVDADSRHRHLVQPEVFSAAK